jgi:hypothetical protein
LKGDVDIYITRDFGSGFYQISGSVFRSGYRRAKITHEMGKNSEFHVLKCWMFSIEG